MTDSDFRLAHLQCLVVYTCTLNTPSMEKLVDLLGSTPNFINSPTTAVDADWWIFTSFDHTICCCLLSHAFARPFLFLRLFFIFEDHNIFGLIYLGSIIIAHGALCQLCSDTSVTSTSRSIDSYQVFHQCKNVIYFGKQTSQIVAINMMRMLDCNNRYFNDNEIIKFSANLWGMPCYWKTSCCNHFDGNPPPLEVIIKIVRIVNYEDKKAQTHR